MALLELCCTYIAVLRRRNWLTTEATMLQRPRPQQHAALHSTASSEASGHLAQRSPCCAASCVSPQAFHQRSPRDPNTLAHLDPAPALSQITPTVHAPSNIGSDSSGVQPYSRDMQRPKSHMTLGPSPFTIAAAMFGGRGCLMTCILSLATPFSRRSSGGADGTRIGRTV